MIRQSFEGCRYETYFPLYIWHGQPLYIWISDQGQPFRYHFVLQRTDIGLIKKTINRTSRCNKADAGRLFASYYRLNLLLLKAQRCMMGRHLKLPLYISTVTLRNYRLSIGAINVFYNSWTIPSGWKPLTLSSQATCICKKMCITCS